MSKRVLQFYTCVISGFVPLMLILASLSTTKAQLPTPPVVTPAARITSVAWSPDGTKIASGDADGKIIIWDAAAQTVLLELDHVDTIRAIAWSPDSQRLATASRALDVRIWDIATGTAIASLEAPYQIGALSWSHDGSRLAVAEFQGHLLIWNMMSYTLEHEFESGGTYDLNWSLDDTWTVGLNAGGAIVLDAQTGNQLALLGVDPNVGLTAAQDLSSDGQTLVFSAISNGDPTLQPKLWFWDMATYEYKFNLVGHTGLILTVKWNPVNNTVASGGDDGTLRIWDVSRQQSLHVIHANVGVISSLDWSPDGTRLAYGGENGVLNIVDNPGLPASTPTPNATASPGTLLTPSPIPTAAITTAAWSSDSRYVGVGYENGDLDIIDGMTGTVYQSLQMPLSESVAHVVWSPHDTLLRRVVKMERCRCGIPIAGR